MFIVSNYLKIKHDKPVLFYHKLNLMLFLKSSVHLPTLYLLNYIVNYWRYWFCPLCFHTTKIDPCGSPLGLVRLTPQSSHLIVKTWSSAIKHGPFIARKLCIKSQPVFSQTTRCKFLDAEQSLGIQNLLFHLVLFMAWALLKIHHTPRVLLSPILSLLNLSYSIPSSFSS